MDDAASAVAAPTMDESNHTVAAPIVDPAPESATQFQPTDCTLREPAFALPDELWLTVLESPCTFPRDVFAGVMLNLIKNPNITSSHLFRADIFYDSESERTSDHHLSGSEEHGLLRHLKPDYRPVNCNVPGYHLERTIVRQLVPRNPQLDRPLVQTCHLYTRVEDDLEQSLVLYVPHVQQPQDVPFYHPTVARLVFLHQWRPGVSKCDRSGSISISYSLFPGTSLTTKLKRTALHLLETVHKHGQGQLAGYEKRVHLDQVIPQKRYQDTYTRLKARYGRQLAEQWVEVTDPGKHVFEDIGIAAFLIELWRDMYQVPDQTLPHPEVDGLTATSESKPPFPGFVDIGCGNGVLVYILLTEGYEGWGFDARARKTWSIFPDHNQEKLRECLLVPQILQQEATEPSNLTWHNGVFDAGTFIISNHADELTTWTPLLAYLNRSAFIAIPCCSHDLSGARFRAPASTRAGKEAAARLPQQVPTISLESCGGQKADAKSQAAETGSLKRTDVQKKMASAYSTLCSYVTSLAEEVGFKPEKDVLRIPSTRNQCIIGRHLEGAVASACSESLGPRTQTIVGILERELGKSIESIGFEWKARGEKLAQKPGSGH